jgi:excisionase family DNA binding protein
MRQPATSQCFPAAPAAQAQAPCGPSARRSGVETADRVDATVPTVWLRPAEAANYVRCSVSHLLRSARRGDVIGYRCGRGWRFKEVDLNKWLER